MYKKIIFLLCIFLSITCKKHTTESNSIFNPATLTINHQCTNLNAIPLRWIDSAKNKLIIAYCHTSHGSQIITGMQGLITFKGNIFSFNGTGTNGALTLRDNPF